MLALSSAHRLFSSVQFSPRPGSSQLRRSKDPSPATGEGALEGEWSLSPTIIDNKRRTRRRKKTLMFRPLAPALELEPLLSPSRVTNAVPQSLLPTRTTLSGLSRPGPGFALRDREFTERVLPPHDGSSPSSSAHRLTIKKDRSSTE